jgi:hypothetical protein
MKIRPIALIVLILMASLIVDAAAEPLYKPPLRGAPAGGIGGATRGEKGLQLLVPNHPAQTISDQPNLYWYVSKPMIAPVKLTISKEDEEQLLVEKELHGVGKVGINVIRLTDYGIRLHRDVKYYEWCIITDTDEYCGTISIVAKPPKLKAKLKAAGIGKAHYVYAEEGLWYDALRAISEMIDASPDNKALRRDRAVLLEQAGLTNVADAEKK